MMSAPQWNNKVVKWVDDRLPVISMLHHSAYEYPTPKNLSYMWNFGSLAGFVLVTMILTGIFLVMNYTPHTDMAFESVERIMRDVNHGWLIRYIHMNGASMFFICVFIHIFRGLYYGSYKAPREVLWWIGILILLAMMATAFMGYVLPWGQMSFWGATVITNLFSAFPIIGDPLVTWLWGGFSVDNPTLNRFFSLHYLMPFVILGLVVLHVWALHSVRSNNPTGVEIKTPQDSIPFHPYYTIKDLFGLGVFLIFFCAFVFFAPDYLGHPDNYIPANPLVTPPHIVPEWYFLPFYAILRSIDFTILGIPAKLLGVLAMFASIVILFVIPWLDTSKVRSSKFRPVYKWFFWLFVIDTFILGYCGAKAPDDYFMGIPGLKVIVMGQLSTLYYFAHFLVVMPLVGKLERTKPLPASISESVLKEGANA
ncbi:MULTISPECIES: cytochrome b N-terminal domain-containing protein [Thalassospira]|jgi:quinol-cytochrome oxidoreductase complex cytochrome b subunit|uniref:Cytochrome b n=1 Tax=Thalassospira povalilytica TaxID=732237 RepID=A0A8I1M698_9PROT|nr:MULTISPECIES: cytochrome b N-terminal domain-containing protein [Thalassospira]MEE3046548.1 cytochrome b N-terminal domain-containing protein [Pseudomonadota bacterium]MAL40916.1 cytochrome b [Thalassospira sp.]MBN8195962.1 cytochrome b N-terminal domain-containing protein [Thalassospira povalilytica]MCC4241978.1 cytochrome b N-terminal domain-containing protein [Thalassospira povalilytica]PKR52405.1 cytochrome b [Thalassospira povalilytica]|tara:strand:- start:356 stop:1627 length:1272 start_codon:yes stop_codon:yes gene_type:complete